MTWILWGENISGLKMTKIILWENLGVLKFLIWWQDLIWVATLITYTFSYSVLLMNILCPDIQLVCNSLTYCRIKYRIDILKGIILCVSHMDGISSSHHPKSASPFSSLSDQISPEVLWKLNNRMVKYKTVSNIIQLSNHLL